jgi:hypothetical protein
MLMRRRANLLVSRHHRCHRRRELPVAEAALPETAAAAEATASVVRAVQSDNDTYDAWSDFAGILQSEYLSGVNPQVREPFLNAVGK